MNDRYEIKGLVQSVSAPRAVPGRDSLYKFVHVKVDGTGQVKHIAFNPGCSGFDRLAKGNYLELAVEDPGEKGKTPVIKAAKLIRDGVESVINLAGQTVTVEQDSLF